jgi:mono/diheme cytochrome c family protein
MRVMSLAAASAALALLAFTSPASAVDAFEVVKDGIPKPLTSTPGSAARGKALLQQKKQANCLECHRTKDLPGGRRAPNLDGIALGKTEAQLRLSVVDFLDGEAGQNHAGVSQRSRRGAAAPERARSRGHNRLPADAAPKSADWGR